MRGLLFFLICLLATPAIAGPSEALKSACKGDAWSFCKKEIGIYLLPGSGETEERAIGACMKAHWAQVSEPCREVASAEFHLKAPKRRPPIRRHP